MKDDVIIRDGSHSGEGEPDPEGEKLKFFLEKKERFKALIQEIHDIAEELVKNDIKGVIGTVVGNNDRYTLVLDSSPRLIYGI